jgi:catechol 2,3-dioxygenase-like lactoylglutathione lyase family enzyme
MTILGIDTVAIVVADRHKAIRWYRDVLRLEVAYLGPNEPDADSSAEGTPDNAGHWIELGPLRPRTRVHLCEMAETEPGPTGITFLADDIHSDYERMRAAGVRFLYPPKKMDWGEWLTEFLDPDGNQFDLKQPVSTREWQD